MLLSECTREPGIKNINTSAIMGLLENSRRLTGQDYKRRGERGLSCLLFVVSEG